MQEYTDPVDRLAKINEAIRFILLDEAVGGYLSEGPFGRSRGSGRPMPQRYIEAQRLRDSMKQQRVMQNFQRTMQDREELMAMRGERRSILRQAAQERWKQRFAERQGKGVAPATTGAAPTTGDQGTAPATASPDGGLSAPGRGPGTGTSIGYVGPEEIKNMDPYLKGEGPSAQRQAQIDANLELIKQKTKEAGLPSEEERLAAARAEQEKRGVVPNQQVGGAQGQVQASRERARAAGVAPGGPNAPDAKEVARQQRMGRAMEGGYSLAPRKPVVQGPGQAAVSNVTRGMNQPQQGTSEAERTQAARQAQQERNVRPNQNLQAAPERRQTTVGVGGSVTKTASGQTQYRGVGF